MIKLDHAAVHGGLSPTIVGNFLISDGLHWDTLRVRLGGASLATVLEHFPASASAGDRGRAELASERIQNERSSGWDLMSVVASGGRIVRPVGVLSRLTASAHTTGVLDGGHYVAEHKTRLAPGKHASPEARQRAAALAITLGPLETWTREHWRGIAGDKPVLEFVWREAEAVPAAQAA
ncbi:MAG TPA: hypothetical protein VHV75_15310 [Solirubrobacteraceae bacterium]|nr:hypothetical protein [Solirubrobacteraceae bacterium]